MREHAIPLHPWNVVEKWTFPSFPKKIGNQSEWNLIYFLFFWKVLKLQATSFVERKIHRGTEFQVFENSENLDKQKHEKFG